MDKNNIAELNGGRRLLLTGALIWCGNGRLPFEGYITIKDGLIESVEPGKPDEALLLNCNVIRLKNALLLPGFIDTHVHLIHTALENSYLSLSAARELSAVLDTLEEAVKNSERSIIVATGFDESALKEKRWPSMAELEGVTGKHPAIIFRRDFHSAMMNSESWKMFFEDPVPQDGIVRGASCYRCQEKLVSIIPASEKEILVRKTLENALARGLTSIHALEGGSFSGHEDVELLINIDRKRTSELILPDLIIWDQTTDVEKVLELGLPRIGGCILIDGSFGSRTAALSEPYEDETGNRGMLFFEKCVLENFYFRAFEAGLQVAVHAEGDAAIATVLDIIKNLSKYFDIKNLRPRIEHFELLTDELIEAAALLGVAAGMQPAFDALWGMKGGMYEHRLGKVRSWRMNRFASLRRAGVMVGGGSDSPVTPLEPLTGIKAAESLSNESERLSRVDALKLYTSDAAWLSFDETRKGKIEKGMRADLIAVENNFFSRQTENLECTTVYLTVVGGRIAYQRKQDTQ